MDAQIVYYHLFFDILYIYFYIVYYGNFNVLDFSYFRILNMDNKNYLMLLLI